METATGPVFRGPPLPEGESEPLSGEQEALEPETEAGAGIAEAAKPQRASVASSPAKPVQQRRSGETLVKPMLYAPEEILVRVADEEMRVDLQACAPQAGVFAAVRQARQRGSTTASPEEGEGDADLCFEEFPGGAVHLKNIVKYLEATAAEERAAAAAAGELGVPAGVLKVDPGAFHLEFDTDNVGAYLEGAAKLRCPRLLRDTVLAPAAKELSSRRVLALLERVVQFTAEADCMDSSPVPEKNKDGTPSDKADYKVIEQNGQAGIDLEADYVRGEGGGDIGQEDLASREQVTQAFCQVIQRLCARLDAVDFKLTAALAAGSPWASLEVLRAYRVKVENLGRMNYALQSVSSTVRSFFYEEDKSLQQQKQEWKEHHFALHVFRKQILESTLYSSNSMLKASAEKAMEGEDEADWNNINDFEDKDLEKLQTPDQAEDDIPEAICDGVTGNTLAALSGFVFYCDPLQVPPVLAAAMVRSLLLVSQTARARTLFEAVFVRSRKVQAMVNAASIPVDFLGSVKSHRVASIVLRRILSRYESLERSEFCHLVDHVLLEEFRNETHCLDLVLSNELVQDIVVYCRVSTRGVANLENDTGGGASALLVAGSDAEMLRVRKVGEKLFAAAFVLHNGFLPLKEEPDRRGENWPAGPLGVAECPWDNGDLDLTLLQHVPCNEDALHLSRRVLLRGLLRRQRAGVENDVPTIVRLWELGRWTQCRDAVLISEAFSFVSSCWRLLKTTKAATRWEDNGHKSTENWLTDEESLFGMFADLEFWRLQPKELMTPWVPPQLLACHIATRCKLLDEQQKAVYEDNQSNLREINRLRHTVSQLFSKLEVVDARSVQSLQKQAEVVDTVRTLR